MQLSSQGITVDLPSGWEGRIVKRAEAGLPAGAKVALVERTYPITHLGNFALPDDRGDFGSGAVDIMNAHHVFIAMLEFGPESVGQPLFARLGRPTTLRSAEFNPNGLQRVIPGQAGHQVFFTEHGRAFCAYVVLGSHANARTLVPLVNEVLAATRIDPR